MCVYMFLLNDDSVNDKYRFKNFLLPQNFWFLAVPTMRRHWFEWNRVSHLYTQPGNQSIYYQDYSSTLHQTISQPTLIYTLLTKRGLCLSASDQLVPSQSDLIQVYYTYHSYHISQYTAITSYTVYTEIVFSMFVGFNIVPLELVLPTSRATSHWHVRHIYWING